MFLNDIEGVFPVFELDPELEYELKPYPEFNLKPYPESKQYPVYDAE